MLDEFDSHCRTDSLSTSRNRSIEHFLSNRCTSPYSTEYNLSSLDDEIGARSSRRRILATNHFRWGVPPVTEAGFIGEHVADSIATGQGSGYFVYLLHAIPSPLSPIAVHHLVTV